MSGPALIPVGPGVPESVAGILQSHADAILALQEPGAPVTLPKIALAADLPPAADWPDTVIQAVDKNCIAVSTETSSGVWAWKRADGSAL